MKQSRITIAVYCFIAVILSYSLITAGIHIFNSTQDKRYIVKCQGCQVFERSNTPYFVNVLGRY